MNYIRVKGWDEFQHYKDRTPPWIKLHNSLLENYDFECLPDASKAHLLCIWLLASRTNNKMPANPGWIEKKIGATSKVNLELLVSSGFLEEIQELQSVEHDASAALQEGVAHCCLEGEESREEREESKEDTMSDKSDAAQVLIYMNEVLGTKYRTSTKSHIENISGRLSEGFSVDDCKSVIDSKSKEWGGDQRMAQYLRPQTLFGPSNFQGYLMASRVSTKASMHDLSSQEYTEGEL